MPIVEIALRMITLAGFVPQEDIEIQIVGARDGEKLHEELFDDNEMRQTTCMPGILLVCSKVTSLHRSTTCVIAFCSPVCPVMLNL